MAQVRKYANLPDLDTAPDIYETPELTEDNSTIPATTTARSASETSDEDTEDETSGVQRRHLQADEARNRFQPSRVDARGVDFSDNVSHQQRRSYRTATQRRRRRGEVLGDVSDDEDEDFKARLERLQREVRYLENEYERKVQEGDKGVEEVDAKKFIREMSDSMDAIYTKRRGGVKGAENLLARSIDKFQKATDEGWERAGEDGQIVAPPIQSQVTRSQLAEVMRKAAEFDMRMDAMEKALGLDGKTMPDIGEQPPFPVFFTLEKLEKTLDTVQEASSSNLDSAHQNVRRLIQEAEHLKELRTSESEDPSARGTTVVNGDSKDIRDPEYVSKINALHASLPTINEISPLLPLTLERLKSLKLVHASAYHASKTLDTIEKRQDEQNAEIKKWKESLEQVEKNIKEDEARMQRNAKVVGDWVKNLEQRIANLEE